MSLIKLETISKKYNEVDYALYLESFSIGSNSKVAIVGETGSGKSTLLKTIAGLEKPDTGSVWFNDEPVYTKLGRLIPGHPEISYLSQYVELPKFITIEDFLNDPYISSEELDKTYELCRISHLKRRYTHQISGGEKQRVALAKLLINSPRLLLLDEPFSNLDGFHKNIIKEVVEDLKEMLEMSIVLVSHDPKDVLPWAKHIVVLKKGLIVQEGNPKEIYKYPLNEYVAGLFGPYQRVNARDWNVKNFNGSSDTKSIVRPEMFDVRKSQPPESNGVITSVSYYGGFEEVTLKVLNDTITISTAVGRFQVHDNVTVRLNI